MYVNICICIDNMTTNKQAGSDVDAFNVTFRVMLFRVEERLETNAEKCSYYELGPFLLTFF